MPITSREPKAPEFISALVPPLSITASYQQLLAARLNKDGQSEALNRWRARWRAIRTLKWNQRWAVDGRLVILTLLNALVFWPWIWLRNAFDAGDHHPNLVFGLLVLTLFLWFQLAKAVTDRFR